MIDEVSEQNPINPPRSFFSRFKNTMNTVYDVAFDMAKTTVISTTNILIRSLKIVSSAVVGVYALLFISGRRPEEMGLEWWQNMSLLQRIFSVINLIASWRVNDLTNEKFFALIGAKFKKNIPQMFKSIWNFCKNSLGLMFGALAAIIYAVIAYQSFLWLNQLVSMIASVAQFATYLTRRTFGIIGLTDKMEKFFSKNYQFKMRIVNEMKNLPLKDRKHFNTKFIKEVLTEDNIENFLLDVYQEAAHLEAIGKKMFQEKTHRMRAIQALKISANLFNATLAAISVFPLGMLRTDKFSKILLGSAANDWMIFRYCIASLAALINSAFYFLSGYDTSASLEIMYEKVKEDPKNIKTLIILIALNAFTSSTYYTISKTSVDKNNFLYIDPNGIESELIALTFAIMILITGMNNTDIAFENGQEKKMNVNSIIRWLENNDLSPKTIKALKQSSHFNPPIEMREMASANNEKEELEEEIELYDGLRA